MTPPTGLGKDARPISQEGQSTECFALNDLSDAPVMTKNPPDGASQTGMPKSRKAQMVAQCNVGISDIDYDARGRTLTPANVGRRDRRPADTTGRGAGNNIGTPIGTDGHGCPDAYGGRVKIKTP